MATSEPSAEVTDRIQIEGVPTSLRDLLTSRVHTIPEPDRELTLDIDTLDIDTIRQLCGGDRIVARKMDAKENPTSLDDYGSLLSSICHCDDYHELQTLADEFIGLYKRLERSSSRGIDVEDRALSYFFCECDAYAPDDDEIWGTDVASTFINSAQLREAAALTLTQLGGNPPQNGELRLLANVASI